MAGEMLNGGPLPEQEQGEGTYAAACDALTSGNSLDVEFRPRAAADLESALVYRGVVLSNPAAARSLYGEICKALDLLAKMPGMGHAFSDGILEGQDYRWWLAAHHKIVYTARCGTLTVWRIFHERQDIDDYAIVEFPTS